MHQLDEYCGPAIKQFNKSEILRASVLTSDSVKASTLNINLHDTVNRYGIWHKSPQVERKKEIRAVKKN